MPGMGRRSFLRLAVLLGVASACAHAPPPAPAPPIGAFTPEQQRALAGNWIHVDDAGEAAAFHGPAVLLTSRFGDESQTTFRIEQGSLVERGTSSGGSGQTVFTPDADGQRLHVSRRVESDQLSAPLEVTFTYRKR